MIVNVDDVKLLYKQYNIENNLTDEEIEQLIEMQINSVLAQLGVSLEPTIHNYTKYNHHPKKPLTLPLPEITGIDRVIVNGKRLHPNEYFFDEINGIVYITKNYGCCPLSYVHVNYITRLSDLFIEKLKSLVLDMLLLMILPHNNEEGIKSIKEGDVTVTYDDDWGWWNQVAKAIPIKLGELEDMLHHSSAFMIG